MDHTYVLLTEMGNMWAEMLMQVLEDNGIPCAALPVHGIGLVLKTGMQERQRIYVPAEHLEKAKDLVEILFSGDAEEE